MQQCNKENRQFEPELTCSKSELILICIRFESGLKQKVGVNMSMSRNHSVYGLAWVQGERSGRGVA